MDAPDIIGLAGVALTSVVGPYIVAKQRANDRKAKDSADVHISNSEALSKMVGVVETMHTKMEDNTKLLDKIHTNIEVLKDRGHR